MTNIYGESDQQYKRFPEPESVNFKGQAQPSSTSLAPPFMQGCCCFSLRTGCLIFGWLGIICSIAGAVLLGVLDYLLVNNVTKEMKKNPALDNVDDQIIESVNVMVIVIIVLSAIMALCYMLLLIGVYKKKTILLKIFVGITCGILVLSFLGFIMHLASGHINSRVVTNQMGSSIWMIINILVVHCYHRELQIELMGTPIIHSAPIIHPASIIYSAPPRYEP